MTASCQCRDCRYPAVGDPEVKALHADRHAEFQRRVDAGPDWGFRKPTSADILRWTIAEYDVPRTCPRVEDIGKPAHPVHHQ